MTDPDPLAAALAWLQARTEHRFTIDAGMFMLDGAIIRGREPGFRWDDEGRESYRLEVYVPAFSIKLDPDALEVEIVDGELRLRTRFGHLGITDDGAPAV